MDLHSMKKCWRNSKANRQTSKALGIYWAKTTMIYHNCVRWSEKQVKILESTRSKYISILKKTMSIKKNLLLMTDKFNDPIGSLTRNKLLQPVYEFSEEVWMENWRKLWFGNNWLKVTWTNHFKEQDEFIIWQAESLSEINYCVTLVMPTIWTFSGWLRSKNNMKSKRILIEVINWIPKSNSLAFYHVLRLKINQFSALKSPRCSFQQKTITFPGK